MLYEIATNGTPGYNVKLAYKFPNKLNPTSDNYLMRPKPGATRRTLTSALTLIALTLELHAQSLTPRPEFEAASIKPNTTGGFTNLRPPVGGRFTATNATLKMLIDVAYKVRTYQLSGGPGWLDSEHYDLTAKAEGNANQDQVFLMLQKLLEDRFQLRLHHETKEMPVYALVVAKNGAKNGSKLKEFTESGCVPFDPDKPPPPPPPPGQPFARGTVPCGVFLMMGNALEATKTDIKQFASALTNMQELGRPVIDKTGLTGTYAIHLEYAPVGRGGRGLGVAGDGAQTPLPDASGPSIFTALQEQLGLKLEPQKAPIEILVIDHAEKPTEN
jgi:uncharacterized protein (TIGR03435 family)